MITLGSGELRRRWRTAVWTAVAVAVLVGAVLATIAGARRGATALDRYVDDVRVYDGMLFPSGQEQEATVAGLADRPEIVAVEPFTLYTVVPEDEPPTVFTPFMADPGGAFGADYFRWPLVAGRRADPDAPLEVVLGEGLAARYGVGVGDQLHAVSFAKSQEEALQAQLFEFPEPEGPALTFDVVGIAREIFDLAGRPDDTRFVFLTPAFDRAYADRIAVFVRGAAVDIAGGVADGDLGALFGDIELDRSVGGDDVARKIEPPLDAIAVGLFALAAAMTVAGTVVLFQAARRMAVGAADLDGVLEALGATRWGRRVVLVAPMAAGVVAGCAGGIGLAVLASTRFPYGLGGRVEPSPGIDVDVLVLAGGGAAAVMLLVGLTVLAAVPPLLGAEGGAGVAGPKAQPLDLPVPATVGLMMARGRGVRGGRALARSATVAVAVGTGGVLAATVFGGALGRATTDPAIYGWGVSGILTGSESSNIPAGTIDEAALADDDRLAAAATVFFGVETFIDGVPIRSLVVDDLRGHARSVVVHGREPTADDEIALGGQSLADLGLSIGDVAEVRMLPGTRPVPLRVVGQVLFPIPDDAESNAGGALVTAGAARAAGFDEDCSAFDVACSRNYFVDAVDGAEVTDVAAAHLDPDGIAELVLPRPPTEAQLLDAVRGMPGLLAGFLAAAGLLGLVHALSVSVRRRSPELRTLRAVGLTRRQIRGCIAVLAGGHGVAGTVVGLLTGVVVGRVAWGVVADSLHLPVSVPLPLLAVVLASGGALLGCQCVGGLAARASAFDRPANDRDVR